MLIGIVRDLKDPDNYINYINSNKEFIDFVKSQYEEVKDFKFDIK